MSGSVFLFGVGGCAAYLGLMSAVGKWLARCGETTSTAYMEPLPSVVPAPSDHSSLLTDQPEAPLSPVSH